MRRTPTPVWLLSISVMVALVASHPAASADAVDESLTLDDYMLNGVPKPSRSWRAADLAAATAALVDIGLANPSQLPRLGSKKSGKLFERLTSDDILDRLEKGKLSTEERLRDATALLGAFRSLAYVYLKAISQGTRLDMEMAAITGFALELTVRTFTLLDEHGRSIPPDAPEREAMVEGIVTYKSGLNELVGGAVGSMAQTAVYRPEARVELAMALKRTLPRMTRYLPGIQTTDMTMYLQELARAEQNSEVRESLDLLLESLGSS